jgi:hypothetical protein
MRRRQRSALPAVRPLAAQPRCMAHGPHGLATCAVLRVFALLCQRRPRGWRVECRAAFEIGGPITNSCPANYSRLETEAACKSLAAIAGSSMYGGSDKYSYYPAGCFWHTVSRKLYWNTHGSGASSSFAQPLCAGAPATPGTAAGMRRCVVASTCLSSRGARVLSAQAVLTIKTVLGYSALRRYKSTHHSGGNWVLRWYVGTHYSGGTRVLSSLGKPAKIGPWETVECRSGCDAAHVQLERCGRSVVWLRCSRRGTVSAIECARTDLLMDVDAQHRHHDTPSTPRTPSCAFAFVGSAKPSSASVWSCLQHSRWARPETNARRPFFASTTRRRASARPSSRTRPTWAV